MDRRAARASNDSARARIALLSVAAGIALALVVGSITWTLAGRDSETVTAPETTPVVAEGTEPEVASTPSTVEPTTAPTTTEPPTTTTAAPPPDPLSDPAATIRAGAEGPAVEALQRRLLELGYWLPEVDGKYGPSTAHAVTAFQKVQGLTRDGVAGPDTRGAIAGATRPAAREATTPGRRMEVDLGRQVTMVVTDGKVDWVLDVSTGKASTPTRAGSFTITRQIDGLRISDLGRLWRPKYFDGGIAFHGAPSVPPYPASHGCVRLPNPTIDWIWATDVAPVGTPVTVF